MAEGNADMTAGGAPQEAEGTRRDFLYIGTAVFAAAGIGRGVVWPLIDQLNPADNVKALASIEVDISKIELGQQAKFLWRGKPIFVRHRTAKDIEISRAVPMSELKDPQTDESRVQKPEWLVMIGVCTHLGCVPLANSEHFYDGWYCPCHGSQYDASGRIRKGPAPKNLVIPPYVFLNDTTIKIG